MEGPKRRLTRVAPDGRQRDLFPLGLRFSDQDPSARVSRRGAARRGRRRVADSIASDAVGALNSLAGFAWEQPAGEERRVRDGAVREHIVHSALSMGAPPPDLTPAEALGALRGASVYDTDDEVSHVLPLDPRTVSLPSSGFSAVALDRLYGEGGADFVDGFCRDSVLEKNEAHAALDAGPERVYMDPELASDKFKYAAFVCRLVDAGVVELVGTPPCEEVGFFGGRQER